MVKNDNDEVIEEPNKNVKIFYNEPDLQLKDYTTIYQWHKLDKTFTKFHHENNKYYCTPNSDKSKKLG